MSKTLTQSYNQAYYYRQIQYRKDLINHERKITRLTAIAMAGILITGTSLNPKTAYVAEDAHTIAYNDSAMDENYYSGEDINTSIAPDEEYKIWAYTLDKEHNIINLLNLKDKNQTNLIIYDNYMINGECYKAELYNAHSTFVSNKTLESVIFGKNVKITACISDGRATGMFSGCTNLKRLTLTTASASEPSKKCIICLQTAHH